ncbi:MAG: hypothetical protein IKN27_01055 [Selenomonadaceae bacterium]|nr:hypothetical protein [Selenomonadaceae bacterium]
MNNLNEDKIKALREHILHECRQQGFTIYEMQCLLTDLEGDLTLRKQECDNELF